MIGLSAPPPLDPCLVVMPPCMGEADRFSLEALRHIHKQLDDDNDGGIEVNESVEVSFGGGSCSSARQSGLEFHQSSCISLPICCLV